ncbi:MAG: hypothetical protein IT456_24470 [Planctomycetes bacterium]|nr:hypothetical protein [Planctomycetota bacterium]
MTTHTQDHARRTLMTRVILRCRALLALLLSIWLGCAAAIAQCNSSLQSGGPIATLRGRVYATVLWDPDGPGPLPTWLVAGGEHLTGGDQVTPVAVLAFDGVQWRGIGFLRDQPVYALTVFNGELIAGGSFFLLPTPGGNADRIARRNATSWAPLGTGVGTVQVADRVAALTVFNGALIAGGRFFTASGVLVEHIARWDGSSWAALSTAATGMQQVTALEPFSGSLYAGIYNFAGATEVRRWNGTTWAGVGSTNNVVTSLRSISGTMHGSAFLYAGGSFTTIGGIAAAKVGVAGQAVTSWSATGTGVPQLTQVNLLVRAQALGGNEVIAAGATTNSAARVWRWNGSTWSALGSVGPTAGTAAATAPARFGAFGYVVGLDDAAASPRAPGLFRYGTDWTPLAGNGISGPVQCLAVDGPDTIVGGAFATVDALVVNGIARRTGTTWTALGAGVAGGTAAVLTVARAANGEVFAGGNFTTADGIAASNVARWNGSAWAPLGTGTNGTVRALLLTQNGDLIAGGDFTTAGGVACNRIARWNGVAWSQLASGLDNTVRCLSTLPNGDLVVGGTFVLAGGVVCNRIARWNGITWAAMAGGMDGAVNALARRPNGDLVAGGAFTLAGGIPRSRLARWNGLTWLPLSGGVPDSVNALHVLPDGDVLAGGVFAAGSLNRLARWDGFNDTIGSVGSGVDGPVLAFAGQPNGEVQIGGDFDALVSPNVAAGNLVIMTTNCPASATPVATACVGPAGPLALTADTLPWVGATFRSTATGYAPQALAVSAFGLLPANLPLAQLHPTGLPNCNLLTSTESLLLALPVAGVSHHELAVPNSAVFAGMQLSHQCLQLNLNGSGLLQSISSSNALTLVMGLL